MAEGGYSEATPIRTGLTATRMQNVPGEKGQWIRELTAVVEKTLLGFPKESAELRAEKVYTTKRFVCHCPGRVSALQTVGRPCCVCGGGCKAC